MNPNPEISLVLPAFNEAAAVGEVILGIREVMDRLGRPYEILVVDDGSTDDTARVAREAGARAIAHSRNRGVGRARKTGLRQARGELIVMTDADGTYPAEAIPAILEELQRSDMVIGARRVEAGTVPILRTLAKNAIRLLASFILGERIPDLNSGLRAFRRSTALKFMNILPDTHSWVSTITLAYLANEYEVSYVPIDYYKRIGRSTFHPIKDTYNYILLVLRTATMFDPLKLFMPISLFLGTFGLVKFIYDWQVHSDVRESDIMIILAGVMVGVLGLLANLIVLEGRGRYLPDLENPSDPAAHEGTDPTE